ncbi:hypothetical protein PM082_015472 [Marasmius tenuissimus]|nr:hypothetical protein PM082_015472 [Marasmius tenuissimus]
MSTTGYMIMNMDAEKRHPSQRYAGLFDITEDVGSEMKIGCFVGAAGKSVYGR